MNAHRIFGPGVRRMLVVALLGVAAGIICTVFGHTAYAPLIGWDVAAILYVASSLIAVLPLDADATKSHALREDPGRAMTDILLVAASLASLVAIGFLLFHASNVNGAARWADLFLSLMSVVISWAIIHTTYLLKYARLFYGQPEGGIDFGYKEPPRYADFAYMAFTIGMTFQVSDTAVQTKRIRTTVLQHALLSFVFGTVIIATTINTLAGLSK